MSISLQADSVLPQGYLLINGVNAATLNSSGNLSVNSLGSTSLSSISLSSTSLNSNNVFLNTLSNQSGIPFAQSTTPIQTVVNRYTGALTTSSTTLTQMFTTSITTKTNNPTIMCYLYLKNRSDQGNGAWALAYIQVMCGATTVMYSGYNGTLTNWIHDYTAEKPYYATNTPAGTTLTFACNVGSYSGTCYFNTPSQSADDGYAIMKLVELAA